MKATFCNGHIKKSQTGNLNICSISLLKNSTTIYRASQFKERGESHKKDFKQHRKLKISGTPENNIDWKTCMQAT